MDTFLKTIIVEAGAIALEFAQKGFTLKTKANLGDLVTQADFGVSDFLVKKILALYPGHGIYSEELTEVINPTSEYRWMIDPVDGTRNFAHGIPFWCILVALWHNDEVVLAAAYNPIAQQLFFAEKGKGATLNNVPLHVNEVAEVDFGFGYVVRSSRLDAAHRDRYIKLLGHLNEKTTTWTHNFGTMFGTCFVASGGVDFYASNAGLVHDYAVPALICAEAGALVTDADGNPWRADRGDIVIANPKLHPKIIELLK